MKKKLTIMVVLVLVAVLAFAACSTAPSADAPDTDASVDTEDQTADAPDTDASADTEDQAAETESYVIGFTNFSVGNTWRIQMEAEFQQLADELKASGTISDYYMYQANGEVQKQIADIQDLITKDVDAILVTCINPDGLNNVLQEAQDAGIVVINFDQPSSADFFDCKVVGDNYTVGYQCASFICDNVQDGANIIQLDGIAGSSGSEAARQGMVDAIAEKGRELNIVAELACDWDYATAKAALESALVANPNIDGILSQGGAMTLAAIEVFHAQGIPLVPMSGEGNNGFLKIWQENLGVDNFKSFGFVVPTWQGQIALEVAVQILNGETVEKLQLITDPGITDDTLEQYIRTDLSDSLWLPTKLNEENLQRLDSLE